jgi:hypothetical protein
MIEVWHKRALRQNALSAPVIQLGDFADISRDGTVSGLQAPGLDVFGGLRFASRGLQ